MIDEIGSDGNAMAEMATAREFRFPLKNFISDGSPGDSNSYSIRFYKSPHEQRRSFS
jgi:hypothetical protein